MEQPKKNVWTEIAIKLIQCRNAKILCNWHDAFEVKIIQRAQINVGSVAMHIVLSLTIIQRIQFNNKLNFFNKQNFITMFMKIWLLKWKAARFLVWPLISLIFCISDESWWKRCCFKLVYIHYTAVIVYTLFVSACLRWTGTFLFRLWTSQ